MKFGRLLAAGKSLVNGDVSGRYQMEKNFRLPQFVSPRNPFKQEKVADPASPPAAVAAPAAPVVAAVAEALPPAKKISPSVRIGGAVHRAILFCLDHNPFSAIGKPKLAGIPRFGKSAQQTELALGRGKAN
jgi:hypothetical protein